MTQETFVEEWVRRSTSTTRAKLTMFWAVWERIWADQISKKWGFLKRFGCSAAGFSGGGAAPPDP